MVPLQKPQVKAKIAVEIDVSGGSSIRAIIDSAPIKECTKSSIFLAFPYLRYGQYLCLSE